MHTTLSNSGDPHRPDVRPRSARVQGGAMVAGSAAASLIVAGIVAAGQLVANTTSSGRFPTAAAMQHVHTLAAEPRPPGSTGHRRAFEHIVRELQSLGLQPAVHDSIVVGRGTAGRVRNILATLRGRESGRPVLLVAHYDTLPASPGAADDAMGVAVVLGALRALSREAPPPLDVTAVFTDAEEAGMLGAAALASDKPDLLRGATAILNFEARGSRGPALIFEASSPDRAVRWLQDADAPGRISSVYQAVYTWLPFFTDFAVLKQGPGRGLNFAFIADSRSYHSREDTAARIDPAEVEELGGSVLSLIDAGDVGDDRARTRSIYFDVAGRGPIVYPAAWARTLAALAALIWIAAIWRHRRRGELSISSVAAGFLLPLLCAAVVYGLALAVSRLQLAAPSLGRSSLGWSCLAIAVAVLAHAGAAAATRARGVVLGVVLFFVAAAGASAVLAPQVSYLFHWTALAAAACGFAAGAAHERRLPDGVLLFVSTAIVLVCWLPVLIWVWIGLTVVMAPIAAALTMLGVFAIVPHLVWLVRTSATRRRIAYALGAVGLLLVLDVQAIAGRRTTPSDGRRIYVADPARGRAAWVRFGASGGSASEAQSDPMRFPTGGLRWTSATAAVVEITPPAALVIADVRKDETRELRVRLQSRRGAPILYFWIDTPDAVHEARLAGAALDLQAAHREGARGSWMRFVDLPVEGVELTLIVDAGREVRLQLCDQSFGLPDLSGAEERPGRRAGWLVDSTLATSTHVF